MGTRLLESVHEHAHVEGVAGFDRDPECCRAAARSFDLEVEADVASLLARTDLDLIYVATPPASHLGLGRAVLAAGHALFLEKPLAIDLEDATAFVAEVEAGSARVAVNFPFATLPGLRRFEEALVSGRAGRPLRVEVCLHFDQWPRGWHKAGPWLAGSAEGGFLREVFSHFAYLTTRLLGPLTFESASLHRDGNAPTETRVDARMQAGGVPVHLVGGAGGAAPDFNRWTLYCEEESFRVEDWSQVSVSDGRRWNARMPEDGEGRGLDAQLDELVKLARGAPHRLATLPQALDVMRVVEGIHGQAR